MSYPVIKKLEFCNPLEDDDRALVESAIANTTEVPARTDLISEGDDPTVVHVIVSGFACRYKQLRDGKRQIVAFMLPGDFADPYAFILKKMDHSISTLAPSKVARVSQKAILEMMGRPALARAFLMAALTDSSTLREWVATIGQRSGPQRIAHLFCEINARLRAVDMISNKGVIRLPITQHELSDAVGLSVVHTNRSLQVLRKSGLITFASANLEIIDSAGLETLCGFNPNYLHQSISRFPVCTSTL